MLNAIYSIETKSEIWDLVGSTAEHKWLDQLSEPRAVTDPENAHEPLVSPETRSKVFARRWTTSFLRYFVSKRYLSERWRGRRSKHRRWGENQRQRLPPSDVHPGRVHVQPKQWCWAHCGWPRPCSPWRGSSPWRAGLALSIRWWGSVVRPLGTVWHSFEWHGFAEFLLHISLDIQVQRSSRAEQIFHQARRYWVQPYANSTKMLVRMMKSWLKLGMKIFLVDKW